MDPIEKAVKVLKLDEEFPHRHHGEYCYSFDGHRSDLDCNKIETPHECNRCHGSGKYSFWGHNTTDCSRCQGTGILGGTMEARQRILQYLKYDEPLDKLLESN